MQKYMDKHSTVVAKENRFAVQKSQKGIEGGRALNHAL